MFNCCFCQKSCKNSNSLRNHERLCPKNLNRKYVSHTKGKPPWNKGITKKTNPELAEKLSAGGKAMVRKWKMTGTKPVVTTQEYWTEERRKEKSEWRKKLHKIQPSSHPNRKLANNKNKMSYPEKVAYEFLESLNIVFEHNKNIGKYWVDFCVKNIIIEIDGEYWHNKEKDAIRDGELRLMGYEVYRIPAKSNILLEIKTILRDVG